MRKLYPDEPRPATREEAMCRNIKTLFNFDPPATDEEVRAASLQFVRKLSGFQKPSAANETAFHRAVDETAAVARRLLDSLVTNAEPKDREVEAERARARAAVRFGRT
jgi:hypothetical protein